MSDEPSLSEEKNPITRSASPVTDGALVFHQLLELTRGAQFNWETFQPGVERAWIYQTGENGPAAALIRFQPGSRVPLHEHTGYEHIYILSGSQEDANGEIKTGALVVNVPGTRHRIYSKAGCLALAIYEKPVRFVDEAAERSTA